MGEGAGEVPQGGGGEDVQVTCAVHLMLDDLAQQIHRDNREAGWWNTDEPVDRQVPTKLLLIHSEISEAMEGHRRGLMDDHLPERKMIEVELADAIIRILDLAGALDLKVGEALLEKWAYNLQRADHTIENRAGKHGKKY